MLLKDLFEQADTIDFSKYSKYLNETIESGNILYRSMDKMVFAKSQEIIVPYDNSSLDIQLTAVPSRTKTRTSKINSSNFLQTLSSFWEDFPKREFSTFASLSAKVDQHGFGSGLYIIIPANSVNNFGWMSNDFNLLSNDEIYVRNNKEVYSNLAYRMLRTIESISDIISDNRSTGLFRKYLLKLSKKSKYAQVFDKFKSLVYQFEPSNIRQALSLIDELLTFDNSNNATFTSAHDADLSGQLSYIKDALEKINIKSCVDLIEKFKPEVYGARNFTSIKTLPSTSKTAEVWFEGEYLAIKHDKIRSYSTQNELEILKKIRDELL